jgi:hypothetical protein
MHPEKEAIPFPVAGGEAYRMCIDINLWKMDSQAGCSKPFRKNVRAKVP